MGEEGRPARSTGRRKTEDLPPEAAAALSNPTRRLGHYVLVREIGRGGMGSIWKAWDRTLSRWVAIKILIMEDEEAARRFHRESMLAARLTHPNIVPIFEVGEVPADAPWAAAKPFIVMEFVEGKCLAEARIPLLQAVKIMIQVSRAVEFAHKMGVIHRDLKPHNILLSSEGWPYVTDFGLAKAVRTDSTLSSTGMIMGTPPYMPPEQAQGALEEVDARSDVYSLGATLYHLATGRPPFEGKTGFDILMKVLRESPEPPRCLNPAIPEALESILLGALQKEKGLRPPTAGAFAEELGKIPGAAFPEEPRKLSARTFALSMTGCLALAAGAIWSFYPRSPHASVPAALSSPLPLQAPQGALPQWRSRWAALEKELSYENFRPDSGTLEARARELFRSAGAEASEKEVSRWLDAEIRKVQDEFPNLGRTDGTDPARQRIERLKTWAEALEKVFGAGGSFPREQAAARALAREAAQALAPPGSFDLMISVDPYAEILGIRRNGTPIELPPENRLSPILLRKLPVGDYEVELGNPEHGRRTVRLKRAELLSGETWKISGRMGEPELSVSRLP